jgi:hypothetical protein
MPQILASMVAKSREKINIALESAVDRVRSKRSQVEAPDGTPRGRRFDSVKAPLCLRNF